MIITAKLTIETRTEDGLTLEWVDITLSAPGMKPASASQMGAGETEGTAHKALDDALAVFRTANNIQTSEMTAGESGYKPIIYGRYGLAGGIAAQ